MLASDRIEIPSEANHRFSVFGNPATGWKGLTDLRLVNKRWAESASAQLFEHRRVNFPSYREHESRNNYALFKVSTSALAKDVRHVKILIRPSVFGEANESYDEFRFRSQAHGKRIVEAILQIAQSGELGLCGR